MNRDSNSILMLPRFDPAPGGGGGNLRSAQIVELCADAGFPAQLLGRGDGLRSLEERLVAHTGFRVLLWEDTAAASPVPLARKLGYAVIALPQNVETLAGTPASAGPLGEEAAALALADHVVCIADEESWLLANLGLASDVLPYYPVRAKLRSLESVARRRESGIAGDAPWVVLGGANHVPTREGMRTLLRWIHPALRGGASFAVGGFATWELAGEFAGSGIRFAGALSDRQLEDLMAEARAILVHQDRGAGSLTRIPEALIAGVPVIANLLAARSTRGYVGVTVYESQDELLALLRAPSIGAARPPVPPAGAIGRFTRLLRSAADRHA
jgi:hypothetical protein